MTAHAFNTSTMSKEDLIVLLDKATEINSDLRIEKDRLGVALEKIYYGNYDRAHDIDTARKIAKEALI